MITQGQDDLRKYQAPLKEEGGTLVVTSNKLVFEYNCNNNTGISHFQDPAMIPLLHLSNITFKMKQKTFTVSRKSIRNK